MQTRNKLFDDAARLAGGAVGTFAGIRREMESLARQQFERLLSSMDLVTREEFDAVREMAVKARTEQEAMAMRLAALEGDRPASPEVSPEVSGAKSAGKKPATPKSSKKTG
jgi:BMFP domain-containing protein YqiC